MPRSLVEPDRGAFTVARTKDGRVRVVLAFKSGAVERLDLSAVSAATLAKDLAAAAARET